MAFLKTLYGRPNTIKTFTSLFETWIEPYFEGRTFFKQADLEALVRTWQEQDLSPATICMLIGITTKYLRYLEWPSLDTQRITRTVRKSKVRKEPKILSRMEVAVLLNYTEKRAPYFHTALLLGFHCGLRLGEIMGLQKGDVDFIRGRILIQRSYDEDVPTKSGHARYVRISKRLEQWLFKAYNWTEGEPTEPLFPKGFDLRKRLATLCQEAGVPVVTCHNMRHTFATLALEAKKSPKQVQQALGHAHLSTTVDFYWGATQQLLETDFIDD